MKSTYSLVIDIKRNIYEQITVKQEDTKSRYLSITLTDDNLPLNLISHTVKAFILKPDGTKVFNSVNILDATQGKIEIELTTQALAIPGEIKIELVIYGVDGSILSTKVFSISVEKTLRDDAAIESANEFSALTKAMTDLENAIGSAGQLTALHQDVADAKVLQPALHQDIIDSNTTKTNLDASTQQAETSLRKIVETGNKTFTINANQFTLASDGEFYQYTLNHNCHSSNIIVYIYDANNELLFPVYSIIDDNNILIETYGEALTVRVVINISYMSVLPI